MQSNSQIEIPEEIAISSSIDMLQLNHRYPEFTHNLINGSLNYINFLTSRRFTKIPTALLHSTNITKHEYGKLIRIIGTVIQTGPPLLSNLQERMKCQKCNKEFYKKKKCDDCNEKLYEKVVDMVNIKKLRTIKVQEIENSRHFRNLTVVVEDNGIPLNPGTKLDLTGIVMLETSIKKEVRHSYIFRAIDCKIMEDNKLENNSEFIDSYILCENKREFMISNFCKRIVGKRVVKLALILALIQDCSEEKRGNSHILLVGSTSTGKSRLLKYCTKMLSPSRIIYGYGTTEVGLTACAIKQESGWGLEPGALITTDLGLCCIESIDLLQKNEKNTLLETMEQQTISIAKAGINAQFKTRNTIIATCNAFSGTYLPSRLNISSPLLSRFDLILELEDDIRNDAEIAKEILKNNQNDDFDEIKTIINYLKHEKIEENDTAKDILVSYYQIKKEMTKHKELITIRVIEGLLRLARAHGKLLNKICIDEEDAWTSVFLFESSLIGVKLVDFDSERVFIDKSYFEMKIEEYKAFLDAD